MWGLMAELFAGREDDHDDHSFQVREVYALYGLSSYFGQVMEKSIVTLADLLVRALARRVSEGGGVEADQFEVNLTDAICGLRKQISDNWVERLLGRT
jgi:hypothetical protein